MHGRHEWFLHAREGLTGWLRGARYRDATAGTRTATRSRASAATPPAGIFACSFSSQRRQAAVAADCLRLAGVPLAFLQEARFGGACERLALLAHGSAPAGFLREREGEIQRQHQGGQQNAFHVAPPSLRIGSFKPNGCGLYDMIGRVREWTSIAKRPARRRHLAMRPPHRG